MIINPYEQKILRILPSCLESLYRPGIIVQLDDWVYCNYVSYDASSDEVECEYFSDDYPLSYFRGRGRFLHMCRDPINQIMIVDPEGSLFKTYESLGVGIMNTNILRSVGL